MGGRHGKGKGEKEQAGGRQAHGTPRNRETPVEKGRKSCPSAGGGGKYSRAEAAASGGFPEGKSRFTKGLSCSGHPD
ncbi:hypothetical protein SL003B_0231 [Polymorphum gilvum SL003B-26A1]|uniref:Uncharacterized protein n=1 Tax=Polymorphum gilvum (strain LMG 25793 / CGMCC 1.9160 / SL003B-26A1) TaxID=991905 RepID=F2J0D4_POLGS|nr:hypothetical protein SL003B_0231 [Polymorphum gilvum SL003B-26A1]